MQDRAPGKMAAALVKRQTWQNLLLTAPKTDDIVRTPHPTPISLRVPDRDRPEGVTERDGETGQVRMTAGNSRQTANCLDFGEQPVVQIPDRIPQHIAVSGLDNQRTMADPDLRRDSYSE